MRVPFLLPQTEMFYYGYVVRIVYKYAAGGTGLRAQEPPDIAILALYNGLMKTVALVMKTHVHLPHLAVT